VNQIERRRRGEMKRNLSKKRTTISTLGRRGSKKLTGKEHQS
jgi:hypothetical protein